MKNKAVNAPDKFEEIVMVVIIRIIVEVKEICRTPKL